MATISSHVLDSVIGTHAAGIRISCIRRDAAGSPTLLFDKQACEQGRVSESVDTTVPGELELIFHCKDYFEQRQPIGTDQQIVSVVVLRMALPDDNGNYHCPIMLSPHSYSVWWSGS